MTPSPKKTLTLKAPSSHVTLKIEAIKASLTLVPNETVTLPKPPSLQKPFVKKERPAENPVPVKPIKGKAIKKHILDTLITLCTRFPAAFFLGPHRKPLKIGIREDIVARIPEEELPLYLIKSTLAVYVTSIAYRFALIREPRRVTLDGEPDAEVEPAIKEQAKDSLKAQGIKVYGSYKKPHRKNPSP